LRRQIAGKNVVVKRKLAPVGPAPWGYHESGGIVPDVPEVAPGTPTRDETLKPAKRITHELTDAYVEAVRDFAEGQTSWLFDTKQPGLRCRIGKNRASWVFYHDNRRHGRGRKGNSKGRVTSKVLGQFPVMRTDDARRAAAVEAGKLASGTALPGKRNAQKFHTAWAAYLDRLKSKVATANKQRQREGIAPKPARWAANAEFWGKQWLLPQFGSWTSPTWWPTQMPSKPSTVELRASPAQ
jgi:hypothetical protein